MLAKIATVIIIAIVLFVLLVALVYASLWVSAYHGRKEESQGRQG